MRSADPLSPPFSATRFRTWATCTALIAVIVAPTALSLAIITLALIGPSHWHRGGLTLNTLACIFSGAAIVLGGRALLQARLRTPIARGFSFAPVPVTRDHAFSFTCSTGGAAGLAVAGFLLILIPAPDFPSLRDVAVRAAFPLSVIAITAALTSDRLFLVWWHERQAQAAAAPSTYDS